MERTTVGIIGYGRFGRLWARIIKPHHDVVLTDKQPADDARFATLADLCARADAIFLCVPINRFAEAVREMAPHVKRGTVVFDTCSVKQYPASVMTEALAQIPDISLIATHPMFGPDSAANGVAGLPMVVWPLRGNERFDPWNAFLQQLGIRTVRMSPEQHDLLAAYSQGVTHYVGRLLDQMQLEETPIDTQGFRILRSLIAQTCNDSWELFRDLQMYNAYTHEMRQKFEQALSEVNARLAKEG